MGILIFVAVLVVMAAVIESVLADEVSAWLGHLAEKIVTRGAARTTDPDRWAEEWLAELDSRPGAAISRVGWALSIRSTARSVSATEASRRRSLWWDVLRPRLERTVAWCFAVVERTGSPERVESSRRMTERLHRSRELWGPDRL